MAKIIQLIVTSGLLDEIRVAAKQNKMKTSEESSVFNSSARSTIYGVRSQEQSSRGAFC